MRHGIFEQGPEMRRFSLLLLLSVWALSAFANNDPRYQAVEALGKLNGVALQCRYIDQVRTMKAALVTNAPKERSFGLLFDQATNDAFLAFIKNNSACPTHDEMIRAVEHQVQDVAKAFAATDPKSDR